MIRVGSIILGTGAIAWLVWLLSPMGSNLAKGGNAEPAVQFASSSSVLPTIPVPSTVEHAPAPAPAAAKESPEEVWEYRSDPDSDGEQLISQLTIQKGGQSILFTSHLNSGRMTAPDGEGKRISSDPATDKTQFTYTDSFGNQGSITVSQTSPKSEQIVVSFEITEINDPRAMFHYGTQNYTKID